MSKDITPENVPDSQKLNFMRLTAKFAEIAENAGGKYMAGFISPDGSVHYKTNMDPDDPNFPELSSHDS